MMRPLIMDDVAKTKIARVLRYAEQNPYLADTHKGPPPGDNKNYVCRLNTYRCVFTYTHSGKQVFRHLSISVPSAKYPNIPAVLLIGQAFGFTGWDGETFDFVFNEFPWATHVNTNEHCIVIVQEVEEGRIQ